MPVATSSIGRDSKRSQGMRRASLTFVDVVGLGFGVLGVLWSLLAVLKITPTFKAMFADFGGELPVLTRLMSTGWLAMTLGSTPLVAVAVGILAKARAGTRSLLTGVAVLLGFAMPALFLVAMYLPMFSMADAVK